MISFAFGLGDGRIYYWNVSNKRQLELITLSYSTDSKVLSVSLTVDNYYIINFECVILNYLYS